MSNVTRTTKQQKLAVAAATLAKKMSGRGRQVIGSGVTIENGRGVDAIGKVLTLAGFNPQEDKTYVDAKQAVAEYLGVPSAYFTKSVTQAIDGLERASDDLRGSERRQTLAKEFANLANSIRKARLVKRNAYTVNA